MAEEVISKPTQPTAEQSFLTGLGKLIANCPSCQGYGSEPPIPTNYVGTKLWCGVCGPVRDFVWDRFCHEFLCLT
jgi:hypothetical protein